MFRPGAKKLSPEEIKLAELNEQVETSLRTTRWAALNNKGLREVYNALPEILPSIQNTEALEAACQPEPVSLARVLVALDNTNLLSRLQLK